MSKLNIDIVNELISLRTEENITVKLTARKTVEILLTMASFGGSILTTIWAAKDYIRLTIQTKEELDNYDLNTIWD